MRYRNSTAISSRNHRWPVSGSPIYCLYTCVAGILAALLSSVNRNLNYITLAVILTMALPAQAAGIKGEVKEAIHDTGQTLKQTGREIKEGARKTTRETKEAIKKAGKETKEGIKNAGRQTREGLKKAGKETADELKKVGQK